MCPVLLVNIPVSVASITIFLKKNVRLSRWSQLSKRIVIMFHMFHHSWKRHNFPYLFPQKMLFRFLWAMAPWCSMAPEEPEADAEPVPVTVPSASLEKVEGVASSWEITRFPLLIGKTNRIFWRENDILGIFWLIEKWVTYGRWFFDDPAAPKGAFFQPLNKKGSVENSWWFGFRWPIHHIWGNNNRWRPKRVRLWWQEMRLGRQQADSKDWDIMYQPKTTPAKTSTKIWMWYGCDTIRNWDNPFATSDLEAQKKNRTWTWLSISIGKNATHPTSCFLFWQLGHYFWQLVSPLKQWAMTISTWMLIWAHFVTFEKPVTHGWCTVIESSNPLVISKKTS